MGALGALFMLCRTSPPIPPCSVIACADASEQREISTAETIEEMVKGSVILSVLLRLLFLEVESLRLSVLSDSPKESQL